MRFEEALAEARKGKKIKAKEWPGEWETNAIDNRNLTLEYILDTNWIVLDEPKPKKTITMYAPVHDGVVQFFRKRKKLFNFEEPWAKLECWITQKFEYEEA